MLVGYDAVLQRKNAKGQSKHLTSVMCHVSCCFSTSIIRSCLEIYTLSHEFFEIYCELLTSSNKNISEFNSFLAHRSQCDDSVQKSVTFEKFIYSMKIHRHSLCESFRVYRRGKIYEKRGKGLFKQQTPIKKLEHFSKGF